MSTIEIEIPRTRRYVYTCVCVCDIIYVQENAQHHPPDGKSHVLRRRRSTLWGNSVKSETKGMKIKNGFSAN